VVAYDAVFGHPENGLSHRKQDLKKPGPEQRQQQGRGGAGWAPSLSATLDCLLIAIDANTGPRIVGKPAPTTRWAGFQLGGAPLALDGKIIMGMSGGEFGTRGYP